MLPVPPFRYAACLAGFSISRTSYLLFNPIQLFTMQKESNLLEMPSNTYELAGETTMGSSCYLSWASLSLLRDDPP